MFKLVTKTYEAPGYTGARIAQATAKALAQTRRETVKVVRMTEAEVTAWEGFVNPTVDELEEVSSSDLPHWFEGESLGDLAGYSQKWTSEQEASFDRWAAGQVHSFS